MTRRVVPIERHAGEPYIEINPEDAERLGIKENEKIRAASRRGEINIKTRISEKVSSGVVFIPMHYKEAAANILTISALDPYAKTPELKVCAVKIEKA